MTTRRKRARVGRVTYYIHHGSWYTYHRADGKQVRRRVDGGETEAEIQASLLNAQLAAPAPAPGSSGTDRVPDVPELGRSVLGPAVPRGAPSLRLSAEALRKAFVVRRTRRRA